MGQILFEFGRIAEAVPYFQRAVDLIPNAPLLRIALAHAQIELGRGELIRPALRHLKVALHNDNAPALAWRLAATAYGRSDQTGLAALASAEYAFRTAGPEVAFRMATRARRLLKEGTPDWFRAEDLIDALKRRRRR